MCAKSNLGPSEQAQSSLKEKASEPKQPPFTGNALKGKEAAESAPWRAHLLPRCGAPWAFGFLSCGLRKCLLYQHGITVSFLPILHRGQHPAGYSVCLTVGAAQGSAEGKWFPSLQVLKVSLCLLRADTSLLSISSYNVTVYSVNIVAADKTINSCS